MVLFSATARMITPVATETEEEAVVEHPRTRFSTASAVATRAAVQNNAASLRYRRGTRPQRHAKAQNAPMSRPSARQSGRMYASGYSPPQFHTTKRSSADAMTAAPMTPSTALRDLQ